MLRDGARGVRAARPGRAGRDPKSFGGADLAFTK